MPLDGAALAKAQYRILRSRGREELRRRSVTANDSEAQPPAWQASASSCV
jgi:hypothetical protein